MKTTVGLLLLLTCSLFSVAASAGMLPSKVFLKFNHKTPAYTFFWKTKYENKNIIITRDSTLTVPANKGSPDAGYLWILENSIGHCTDTLIFPNYYSPDKIVTINGITADTIRFIQEDLPLPDGYLAISDPNETDEELSTGSIVKRKTNLLLLILLSAVVVAVTSGLTWVYKRQADKPK